MTSDTKYNGWNNYATWCCNLWLDNDAGTQRHFAHVAQQCADADHEDMDEAIRNLANCIEEYVTELDPLGDTSSMYHDMLLAMLQDVDWLEIASNMMEDVEAHVDDDEEAA